MTKKCKKCGSTNTLMVEYYDVGLPEGVGYDGWSEIRCNDCKARTGRWSMKILGDDELERRYGGTPVKTNN